METNVTVYCVKIGYLVWKRIDFPLKMGSRGNNRGKNALSGQDVLL